MEAYVRSGVSAVVPYPRMDDALIQRVLNLNRDQHRDLIQLLVPIVVVNARKEVARSDVVRTQRFISSQDVLTI